MSEYQTLSCADVSVGDKLPPLDIDISSGLIVGGALATRDFEPVHHDKSVAQASGLPDVFMNILTQPGPDEPLRHRLERTGCQHQITGP